MARSTVGNTIERIRRQLDASIIQETNVLAANTDTTSTTLTLSYDLPPSIRSGTILSIGAELCRVISKNASSKEVVVIRGWQDSDGEAHSTGDEVLISPRFTRRDISEAIIDEISSWGHRLFYVADHEWTIDDQTSIVELPVAYRTSVGMIALHRQWDDDTSDDRVSWPTLQYRLLRGDAATWSGASTSGLLIRMLPPNNVRRSGTIYARFAMPFDVTTNPLLETEDFVADYKLLPSMLELVDLGAKMRILADAETGRSQRYAQDDPRRADEVNEGAVLTVAQTVRNNHQRRFAEEQRRLLHVNPLRAW